MLNVVRNGQQLSVDASGNLLVNIAAGSNVAAGLTGAAVPLSADYMGFNVAGTLVGVSSVNPLPVSLASTTITGTIAVTQSTSPWVDNVTQFGGVNISTGTGISGNGIPRVTVSSDSFPAIQAVTQSTSPWLDGGSDGSFTHPLLTDSGGRLILSGLSGTADVETQILLELRSMKAAIVAMVTESGKFSPEDFNSFSFDDRFVTATIGE